MRKHIPNMITCMNLICGSAAVILALWGYYTPAYFFILAAAVFDFLDGAAARALKAYSDIGKELDSLCDAVSFGLAPAMLLFTWYYKVNASAPSALAFTALLIAVFSALRLAKFNTDSRQTINFIGLPTPACGIFTASIVSYCSLCMAAGESSWMLKVLCSSWFIPVFSVVMSILLICEVPMFSLKHKKASFKDFPLETSFFVTAFAMMCAVGSFSFNTGAHPLATYFSLVAIVIFALYIVLNLGNAIWLLLLIHKLRDEEGVPVP